MSRVFLKYRRLGPVAGRRRRVTARIIIIIIIIVARLAGMTRTVELLVSNERAQVIEADVARPAVTRAAFVGIQTFFGRWSVLAFLLHLVGYRRWWRWWRWRWLRTLPNFGFSIYLHLTRDFFRSRSWSWFWSRQNRFVVEHARYVIFFL